MGRPRKRRREEAINTEDKARNMRASDDKAICAGSAGLQDSDVASLSGNEPGLEISGINGSHTAGSSFEGHDVFSFGVRNGSSFPNTAAFDFDFPEDLTSNIEQGFPNWGPSQDPGQPFSTFADVPLQLQTPPNAPDELESNSYAAANPVIGCSCLFNLYSMLARFQSLPEPSFPYSMGALRNAAALSRGVVACHDCSQAYNSALQNSMLLGTLLQLVIMEYAKLLKHIDEKSKQADKIAFRFGDPSSIFDSRHTGLPDCPMAINVDLNGEEWRTLARKAVAQEVLGNSQGPRGLFGLVQKMGDRQASWRERFSNGKYMALHGADHQQNAETPDHLCVQNVYINNLKRSLEALGL